MTTKIPPAAQPVRVFGRNSLVDSAPETIWSGGGLWVPPTQKRTHDIASTDNLADTSGGTGALTVYIEGLVDGVATSETVALNGTTNVPTVNEYDTINFMFVVTAGSGGANAGIITATAQTDGSVTAHIAAGDNRAQQAVYTVPGGKTAFVQSMRSTWIRGGGGANGNGDVALVITPSGQAEQVIALQALNSADVNPTEIFEAPIVASPGSIIEARATDTQNADMLIAASLNVFLL